MKVIEKKMVHALKYGKRFTLANTSVERNGEIYLHGNHIATYHADNGTLTVNLETLRRWPTVTTRSRLRALGVSVYQKNWNTYIGDVEIFEIPSIRCDVNGVIL
jgi:hypothetical protein